jgi:hypothetical protein
VVLGLETHQMERRVFDTAAAQFLLSLDHIDAADFAGERIHRRKDAPVYFQQVREAEFALDRIVIKTLQRLQGLPTLLAIEFGLIPDVEMMIRTVVPR